MRDFHVRELGAGPRLVLVHGSVTNSQTWSQQLALADRYTLVLPDRPGFAPNPPVERLDFEEHAALVADLLEPRDHLVGHSYGGVVTLLAAALRPDALRSLTVIEPPAFGVARGDPDVDSFVERGLRHWREGPREPGAFLRGFLDYVGASGRMPAPLPPDLEQGARTLMVERWPGEAEIPLDELRAAPFPKLVVSGGHSVVFEKVCDAIAAAVGAERSVLRGAGHSVHRLGAPFDRVLVDFLERAR